MAIGAILTAVADGELTPGEGVEVARLVDVTVRTIETTELEARIAALEERTTR